MTRCEIVAETAVALARLNDPDFDRLHTVLLESPVSPMPDGASDAGQVSLRDISTDEIDVRASVKSPAILLITDAYSNGWHVLPIQSAQPNYSVVPADHALRGIPLAPGEHHFRLVYRPLAFVIGAWVSSVAWLLYAAMLLLFWKRSRRSRSETMTSLVHVAGDHR